MDSFDQSLKYLLHQQPADFVRSALRDPTACVLGRAVQDPETLKVWQDEALGVLDAEGARRLAEKIQNAVLS